MRDVPAWYDPTVGHLYTSWDDQRDDYTRVSDQQWVYRRDDYEAWYRSQEVQRRSYAGYQDDTGRARYPDHAYESSVETTRPRIDSMTQGNTSYYAIMDQMNNLNLAASSSNQQEHASRGSEETIDARMTKPSNSEHYKKRHEDFFKFGRVLRCCWNEQAGPGAEKNDNTKDYVSVNKWGERVYSKYRIFVVIKDNGNHSSTCLPVNTYGGQGVGKRDVVKSHHSILYDKREPPAPRELELPRTGERGMRRSIRVRMESRTDKLDPMSRINFNMPYPIQHNWKVYSLGTVHESSLEVLRAEYNALNSTV